MQRQRSLDNVLAQGEEPIAIHRVREDNALSVAAAGDVVQASGNCETRWRGMARR
jgi:hypothetical protein